MNEQHNENEPTIEQIQGVLKEVSRRIQKNLELLDSLRQAREILETILEEARARKAEKEPKTDNNTQEKDDPLYPDAIKLFRKEKRISVSLLQRSFAIGYGRAVKILETLENEGTACLKRQAGVTSTQMYKVVKPEGLHTDRFDSNGPGTDGVCLGRTKKAPFCENCPTREDDPLYERAVALVMYYKFVTNKLFMTNLSIGRERAAKLIERMKDEGILDPI